MCTESMSRPAHLFVCLRFMCVSLGEGCVEVLCLSGGVCVFALGGCLRVSDLAVGVVYFQDERMLQLGVSMRDSAIYGGFRRRLISSAQTGEVSLILLQNDHRNITSILEVNINNLLQYNTNTAGPHL